MLIYSANSKFILIYANIEICLWVRKILMNSKAGFFFIIILAFQCWSIVIHAASPVENNNAEQTFLNQLDPQTKQVELFFFWSKTCPHCIDAHPHIESMAQRNDWIKLHALEISENQNNLRKYQTLATEMGQKATSVPAFFICGMMYTGWDSEQGMGQALLNGARNCRDGEKLNQTSIQPNLHIDLPLLNETQLNDLSLPVFTVILAGLDAFNPCAFFILLFLLSLLVHARSRKRMLLVGMIFVLVSGLVYFLFMAAWLNLFLLLDSMSYITLIAGLLAVVFGVLNTREFFYFHEGAGLSISEQAKPGLFKRMGNLISADRLPGLLFGTITLAIVANSYELLCTAGFPMVYTRTLTMNQLDTMSYYLYLALYNFIYIIPLMVIVFVFTMTLGSRKLSQKEGRLLKLLSGIMMLLLGGILIFSPEKLTELITGVILLVTALLLVIVIWYLNKIYERQN